MSSAHHALFATPVLLAAALLLIATDAAAQEAVPDSAPHTPHLAQFGAGAGPTVADGVVHVLDATDTNSQSNAVAYDLATPGAHESVSLRCELRVLEGGDGGAFVFLNTTEYGARGPAPFVASWVEPNLRGSFAVGIDVHNPKNVEPFGEWGNYQDRPEREVSLHFDGRELVKRVCPTEFRGEFAAVEIDAQHVVGGADVTVRIGGSAVYDRFFVAGLLPYETRLAIGAGTRADATTRFDVRGVQLTTGEPVRPRRPSKHVEVFNHVLTDNSKNAFEKEVELPPLEWSFGRVILTLDIHDAGPDWDEWDRNGMISVFDADGVKHDIVPFITSYRTECHWEVDVTHFRPLLAGKTRFEVEAGTRFYKNRGFMMSVALEFHHGVPELEPYRVVPVWNGGAQHGALANHFADFFTPREIAVDAQATAARLWVTTTGHSQVGEFTPSRRTIMFVGDTSTTDAAGPGATGVPFENVLWKDDCYLNPNRPQFGTWKYSRAGWAPGDVVAPWWIDLTPHLVPGKTARLTYAPEPYEFGPDPQNTPTEDQIKAASHQIRSYLILYRTPQWTGSAPTLRITTVAGDSNASRAGMQAGDHLAEYDGRRLESIDDLRAAIGAAEAAGKTSIPVVFYRGAERTEVEVGPGKLGVGLTDR